MQDLNVAILQADLVWENPDENLAYFTKEIQTIDENVDLIVLPEMFTTGFSMNAKILAEEVNGRSLKWMQQTAQEKQACVTGSIIIIEKDNYYNRLYWVFPDQTVETYNKKHLFTLAKEQETYTAGKEKRIVTYKGWKFCPLICYDLRFPVWARNTEDYDVLLYIANWPEKRTAAWDALLKARAIENMAYCVGVNRVGKDGNGYPYSGHSAIYDALGNRITKSDNHHEIFTETHQLIYKDLQNTRKKLGFLRDRDSFIVTD
jgi:predicted amidohydrolase